MDNGKRLKRLYRGDGWWDLSGLWDDLRGVANRRERIKSQYSSSRQWCDESTHLLGLVGECVFSLETGVPFNRDALVGGDGGYDFVHEGQTFDCKGTKFCERPHLKHAVDAKFWADHYVLAGIDMGNRQAKIFGHATGARLRAAPLRDYGYGNQHVIEHQDLRPGLPPILPSTRAQYGITYMTHTQARAELESKLEDVVRDFSGGGYSDLEDVKSSVSTLDSLDKLELVYRIEEKLNIKLDNLDNIESYDDLLRSVKSKMAC